MAQNVIIAGASYNDVPAIDIPKTGGGTAIFVDTSDANADAADIIAPKTAYVNGQKVTGTGSGGGGTWGSITGTLSDQADLQTALDAKGTYSKPSGGIPSTDMTSSVQTSLGKADSAFQDGDETYYTAAEIETLWAEVT